KWSDNETDAERYFETETDLTAIAISEKGCESNPVQLQIDENKVKPELSVKSTDATGAENTLLTCYVTELTLTATVTEDEKVGACDYTWTCGTSTLTNNPITVEVDETQSAFVRTYNVEAKSQENGCTSTSSISISQDIRIPIAKITTLRDTLTCAEGENVTTLNATADIVDCKFKWSTTAETASITVDTEGTYSVIATAENGCESAEVDTMVVDKMQIPEILITPSAEKVTCSSVTLTASSDSPEMTYVWNDGTEGATLEISEKGTYSVTGVNRYSCAGTQSITIDEDKTAPKLEITLDRDSITCVVESVKATVTETSGLEGVTYKWKDDVSKTSATRTFTVAGTYTVIATYGATACKSEKSVTVKENKQYPIVDIQPLAAVCLPATIDLSTAITSASKYDEIKYYNDDKGQSELTSHVVDVDTKRMFYVKGIGVDGSGCIGDIKPIEMVVKAVSATPIVKAYDECAVAETKSMTALVTSDKTELKFYDESGAAHSDKFDASQENTDLTFYVTNTEVGKCESESAEIDIHIEGTIDYNLVASAGGITDITEVPAASTEITLNVVPTKDTPIISYKWWKNSKLMDSTDDVANAYIYTNTKFTVAVEGRCNSITKDVTIRAIWPTLISPYDGNGKNDYFARGCQITVFNRFNEKVFEGPDGWDGTLNGSLSKSGVLAEPGVYYYNITTPDGDNQRGTIEVVKF
ncbi:MAG: gliding motility-associated C-terminal domain-containing protein, partial [Paludibacteraceae bacterium]|nr:gliding motility-associated C-terminal domain-containing protein [Paludibacteraceae bacterium]